MNEIRYKITDKKLKKSIMAQLKYKHDIDRIIDIVISSPQILPIMGCSFSKKDDMKLFDKLWNIILLQIDNRISELDKEIFDLSNKMTDYEIQNDIKRERWNKIDERD